MAGNEKLVAIGEVESAEWRNMIEVPLSFAPPPIIPAHAWLEERGDVSDKLWDGTPKIANGTSGLLFIPDSGNYSYSQLKAKALLKGYPGAVFTSISLPNGRHFFGMVRTIFSHVLGSLSAISTLLGMGAAPKTLLGSFAFKISESVGSFTCPSIITISIAPSLLMCGSFGALLRSLIFRRYRIVSHPRGPISWPVRDDSGAGGIAASRIITLTLSPVVVNIAE